MFQDPIAKPAPTLRCPDGSVGCGNGNHTWQPSLDLDKLEDRFKLKVQTGQPVPGLMFTCTTCQLSVPTLRPEERPRIGG